MPFTAGQKLRASNLGQLSSTAEYTSSANQTIGNAADTIVAFATADITSSLVTRNTSGVGHTFTLNAAGLWTVGFCVQFAAGATGQRTAFLYTPSSVRHKQAGGDAESDAVNTLALSITKYFASGTILAVGVYQDSGGNLTLNSVPTFGFNRIDLACLLPQ